jgi:hypothetical protein
MYLYELEAGCDGRRNDQTAGASPIRTLCTEAGQFNTARPPAKSFPAARRASELGGASASAERGLPFLRIRGRPSAGLGARSLVRFIRFIRVCLDILNDQRNASVRGIRSIF